MVEMAIDPNRCTREGLGLLFQASMLFAGLIALLLVRPFVADVSLVLVNVRPLAPRCFDRASHQCAVRCQDHTYLNPSPSSRSRAT